MNTPQETVDAGHRAYNARDTEAFCALFSASARTIAAETGTVLCDGLEAIRSHYAARFHGAAGLRCVVLNRTAAGPYVIDHERVWGIGSKPVEVFAIYEVHAGKIQSIRFLALPETAS